MQGAHLAAQIGDAIDEPVLKRLARRPEGAGEHFLLRAAQPAGPPGLDEADENVVHVALQLLEPQHILRPFWLEGIEGTLVLAGSVDAPFDAEALDEFVEAEARRNHTDRAHDRGGIGINFVARQGQEVAAGGGNILAKDVNALVLLGGKLANAAENEMRLHRRAARRIDDDGHTRQFRGIEGLLDGTGHRCQGKSRPQRCHHADGAGEAQDRNNRATVKKQHRLPREMLATTTVGNKKLVAPPAQSRATGVELRAICQLCRRCGSNRQLPADSARSSAAPCRRMASTSGRKPWPLPCNTRPGRICKGARLPLIPWTSTRCAAAPWRGKTGNTSSRPKRAEKASSS